MSNQDGPKDIVRPDAQVLPARPMTLRLGANDELDLSALSDASAESLRRKHGEMAVDRDNRREQLRADLAATDKKLETYSKNVTDLAAENAAVTITNVAEDSLGRTEIII